MVVSGASLALPMPSQSLECSDLVDLVRWVGERSIVKIGLTPDSAAFADRVALKTAKKLDPKHILITLADIQDLKSVFRSEWGAFWKEQRCNRLGESVEKIQNRITARFNLMVAQAIKFPQRLGSSSSEPQNFAKNLPELQKRVARFVSEMTSELQPGWIEAYDGKKDILVEELIEARLSNRQLNPINLLAKSLVSSLDLYANYFDPEEFQDFSQELSGEVTGLGIKLLKLRRGWMIEEVLSGAPLVSSNQVKAGDWLLAVDGKSVATMTDSEVLKSLSGNPGSPIRLDLKNLKAPHENFRVQAKREKMKIADERVSLESLTSRLGSSHDAKVVMLKIPSFYGVSDSNLEIGESTSVSQDVEAQLQSLEASQLGKPSVLVLDMRGNPGGYLEEAVQVGSLFLGDKPIVGVWDGSHQRILKRRGAKAVYQGPLVVLVDAETASAAEILAGALQDYHRAVVIGEGRTYGKGSVQRLFRLEDEMTVMGFKGRSARGVVKFTTSHFYSPRGHTPAHGGVAPDVVLSSDLDSNGAAVDEDVLKSIPEGVSVAPENVLRDAKHKTQWGDADYAWLVSRSRGRIRKQLTRWSPFSTGDAIVNEGVAFATDIASLRSQSANSQK